LKESIFSLYIQMLMKAFKWRDVDGRKQIRTNLYIQIRIRKIFEWMEPAGMHPGRGSIHSFIRSFSLMDGAGSFLIHIA
jgi:hypothetical protein